MIMMINDNDGDDDDHNVPNESCNGDHMLSYTGYYSIPCHPNIDFDYQHHVLYPQQSKQS